MASKVRKLPVYRVSFNLLKLTAEVTKHFTRDFRPTLGRQLQNVTVDLIVSVQRANHAENKLSHIATALEHLLVLETLYQLSLDLRLINQTRFASAAELTDALGSQLGGWQKYAKMHTGS